MFREFAKAYYQLVRKLKLPPPATQLSDSPQEGITFCVDRVEPETTKCPTEPALDLLSAYIDRPLIASSLAEADEFIEARPKLNPLVTAVGTAFQWHYPLVLSPDDIWLTIAQGAALHINNNAETLRERFVRHQGKLTLKVTAWSLEDLSDWSGCIEEFAQQMESHVGPGVHKLFRCDFSTTTPISRIASAVVLMSAFQRYFEYQILFICGIPSVTLRGTPDDWRSIRQRVEALAEYDLKWWTKKLLPICDKLIATAEGKPDQRFWQDIYIDRTRGYCTPERISGWLSHLFPYVCLDGSNRYQTRNPQLSFSIKKLQGLLPEVFPGGLSLAPLALKISDDQIYSLDLFAGLAGVTQNKETLALQPAIAWGVCAQDDWSMILEYIKKHHDCQAPYQQEAEDWNMPVKLLELYNHFDGATLYKGQCEWHLFSSDERKHHEVKAIIRATPADRPERSGWSVVDFCRLSDGRPVSYVKREYASYYGSSSPWQIVVDWPSQQAREAVSKEGKVKEKTISPEQVPVIASGFLQFFKRMMDADGHYFFDVPEFVPDLMLAEDDPEQYD